MSNQRSQIEESIIYAPCGNLAYFDVESGIGYRCQTCFAILGSMGMPRECKELADMERTVEKLKGTR
jgi:hypothetical protein